MTLNAFRWQTLVGLSTPTISDALDKLGLPGALDGPAPVTRTGTRVCGPAFTVGYERIGTRWGTVGDFLDDVPPEAVIVIDNQGRTDCTVWGSIMTRVAHHRAVAATVINGACRDTAEATTVTYPIWACGTFMRTGKDRVRLAGVNVPLTIGSVVIRPGDVVCADADGVVVVPVDRAAEVAEIARRIDGIENAITTSVLSGTTLAQARARHGYHALQTPGRGDDSSTR